METKKEQQIENEIENEIENDQQNHQIEIDQMEEDISQDAQTKDPDETKKDQAMEEAESKDEAAKDAPAEDAGPQEDAEGEDVQGQEALQEVSGTGQAGEKKGFFKKNKKKDKKDEKIEELTDQVKRQMAEFDNFRKRTEKEKTQMYEIGAKSIIEKVLPVVDNFERGLAAVPEENKDDAFVDGMNKIYKQLMTMLEEADVKPIEAVGKEFDPNLHNAVMQTESEEYESGIVAQELQKGYTYRDSVVRHSMVAVVS